MQLQKRPRKQRSEKEGREVEEECMGNVGKGRGREKIYGRLADKEGHGNLGK